MLSFKKMSFNKNYYLNIFLAVLFSSNIFMKIIIKQKKKKTDKLKKKKKIGHTCSFFFFGQKPMKTWYSKSTLTIFWATYILKASEE